MLLTYVCWTYVSIRSVDHHLPLIALSYRSDSGWLRRQIADFELERRISTGEFDGVVALTDTLAVAFSNESQRDKAISDAERLMDGPVNINSRSYDGLTPVHIAIASDNAGVLRYLLEQGADPLDKTALGPGPEYQLDAYRYTEFLKESFPDRDWSQTNDILNAARPPL